ncbi:MAG: PIG-L family deacetylase [Anaerolineales bacterium]|nr:MAG: PIG-L family deacetylase [Anaerolineales bacterium]
MTASDAIHPQDGVVLVVLAHPDDPEFFCGGTIARWSANGQEVHYCLLTRGDKGSDDALTAPEELAKIRVSEQRAAANVLGVRQVHFLDEPDGYLMPSLALRKIIVRVIREVRPRIVITCDPTNFFPSNRYINHADHRAAGEVTLDAVFPAARSALYFPELLKDEGLEPHKVSEIYIAIAQHPNITIDITDYFDQKIRALSEHRSQLKDIPALEERLRNSMLDPDSPAQETRYIERFRRIELR